MTEQVNRTEESLISENQFYFQFEEDFIELNIRCIPMIVRFKLDACGIKLQLKEWSKFSVDERIELCKRRVNNKLELQLYKIHLQKLVFAYTGKKATELFIDEHPEWEILDKIPSIIDQELSKYSYTISLNQWRSLGELERFALIKLSRPGHENKNFPKAVKEFCLV